MSVSGETHEIQISFLAGEKGPVRAYRDGILARGVDLMSYTSGLTSAAQAPDLIDEALGVYHATLSDMVRDGAPE